MRDDDDDDSLNDGDKLLMLLTLGFVAYVIMMYIHTKGV